jgi:hypothetical protein
VAQRQALGVRAVVGDPQAGRRKLERASAEERAALRRASRSRRSASGKALLRKRGEQLERSFAHVLDHGGLRRATLRGCEKLTKRHLTAAMTYNPSLLMRTLFGAGTPRQALAGAPQRLRAALGTVARLFSTLAMTLPAWPALRLLIRHRFARCPRLPIPGGNWGCFSKGA